jgi:hypothetical protein
VTSESLNYLQELTRAERAELDDRVEAFEQSWQSGQRPRIGKYLPADPRMRMAVIVELVAIDMERRIKAGEAVSVEFYLRAFPQLAADSNRVDRLGQLEHDLRRELTPFESWDPSPTISMMPPAAKTDHGSQDNETEDRGADPSVSAR